MGGYGPYGVAYGYVHTHTRRMSISSVWRMLRILGGDTRIPIPIPIYPYATPSYVAAYTRMDTGTFWARVAGRKTVPLGAFFPANLPLQIFLKKIFLLPRFGDMGRSVCLTHYSYGCDTPAMSDACRGDRRAGC